MRIEEQKALFSIIKKYQKNGPIWKPNKDIIHLRKRINRKDVPTDFTLEEYNQLIVAILSDLQSDIHVYYLATFHQNYFAFSRQNWIVIIGENAIMETAMIATNPTHYLSSEKGYTYLCTVKEVLLWNECN